MTDHGRKYGEKPSHPIYVWNGLLERKHVKKVGPAIWLFLWLINAVTFEKDGKGFVLGRTPIKCADVAEDFGVNEQTVREHLGRLENGGYIERTLTPRGYSVQVLNSAKFMRKPTASGRGKTPDHGRGKIPDQPNKTPDQGIENPRPNKSKQLDKAVEEASRTAVWSFLGVDGSKWLPSIRELCANLYRAKNGQTPVELIGACMDGINGICESIPAPLARRAKELRSIKNRPSEIREIGEAEQWQK